MSISESGSTRLLSPLEADTLEALREQLFAEDILHEGDSIGTDDKTLLRFLQARKFNLSETKKMIKNCQHWRKTVSGVGIDELYKKMDPFEFPGREEVFKSWSMYYHKTDKRGRPVNVQYFGGLNLPELYKHMTPEQLEDFIIVNADAITREVLPAASRAAGRRIEQSFVIVDLKGFGLSQFWQVKSLVQMSFQISQDYYPESLGQLAIVNAPTSFTFIWSIVKPWLAKETTEKVDILGKDYKGVLLQMVDADNLPATLGGNCTCSGAGGCGLSSAGPWMDERLARVMMKEKIHDTDHSESSTAAKVLSELTPSTITRDGQNMNTTDEKAIYEDSTVGVVTETPLEVS